MKFQDVFKSSKPLIACIHLLPLPGSPLYSGSMQDIYDLALMETAIFKKHNVDGLIVENFRDKPFYPGRVPAETVAALSAVTREIVREANLPVGVNVLRNDAESAIAIAVAAQAQFIRVNVHMGAVVSDQGIIQGTGHLTLRLRAALRSDVMIFGDVGVKHAAPLIDRGLATETRDLAERGLVDAIIVSGDRTGAETKTADIELVRQNTSLPILIGSGATPENLGKVCAKADGLIVGSYFKIDGKAENCVDEKQVRVFTEAMAKLNP